LAVVLNGKNFFPLMEHGLEFAGIDGHSSFMDSSIEESLSLLRRLIALRVRELEKGVDPASLAEALGGKAIFIRFTSGKLMRIGDDPAVIIAAAVSPHLQPHLFDEAISRSLSSPADYPCIGGYRGKDSRLFIPTGETVMFLLGAKSIRQRMQILECFSEESELTKMRLVSLDPVPKGEPVTSGGLVLGDGVLEDLLGVQKPRPKLGPEFPAQRIEAKLDWEDLVLDSQTRTDLEEISTWIEHGEKLLNEWGMRNYLKPGYRALFYGPSGTGKTLAASLLGKQTGRDVYRIDLSMIVSKFIGETTLHEEK
jgi:hypothetical protein